MIDDEPLRLLLEYLDERTHEVSLDELAGFFNAIVMINQFRQERTS